MITFNGKPVKSVLGRILCSIAIAAGLAVLAFALMLLPIGISIAIVLHPILRLCGRRGCFSTDGGALTITVNSESFKRA